MTDPTAEFFDELQRQGHLPLMEKTKGTLQFDVLDGGHAEHWFIAIDKGDVKVSRQGKAADCKIKADRKLVNGIMSGKVNAFAATLRGEIEIEGDSELMVLFQRLLPGPDAEPVGSRS
jgi:putative sterol carrier protein